MLTTVITTTVRDIPTKDVVRGMMPVPQAATAPLPATATIPVRAVELTVRTMAIPLIPAAAQAVRTAHLPLKVRDILPVLAEEQRALMAMKAAATAISAAALTAIIPQAIPITVTAAAGAAAAQAQVTAVQVQAEVRAQAVQVQAAAALRADHGN